MGQDDRRTRALGADAFAANATEAAELLDRWIVLPPEPLAANAAEHPECTTIERVGPRLVATTLDGLTATGDVASRLADELARVLRVVQGALTLDDSAILVEHVDALRAADRAHGLDPTVVDASVAGLADAMDDHLTAARALLTRMQPAK